MHIICITIAYILSILLIYTVNNDFFVFFISMPLHILYFMFLFYSLPNPILKTERRRSVFFAIIIFIIFFIMIWDITTGKGFFYNNGNGYYNNIIRGSYE